MWRNVAAPLRGRGDDLSIESAEFNLLDDVVAGDTEDSVEFAPQSEVWVTKNIVVWAVDATDYGQLRGFTQRFSQVAAIPEPSTGLLMGLGLVGPRGAALVLVADPVYSGVVFPDDVPDCASLHPGYDAQ